MCGLALVYADHEPDEERLGRQSTALSELFVELGV